MYTIIRRYQLAPGADQNEVVRLVRESYLPLVTGAPGFISYAILALAETGICSISTFADQAAAEEAAHQSAAWVLRSVVQYLAGPPEVTAGEVRIAAGSPPSI